MKLKIKNLFERKTQTEHRVLSFIKLQTFKLKNL